MSVWKDISKELFRRYQSEDEPSVLAVNIHEDDMSSTVRLQPDDHPMYQLSKGQELTPKEIRRYLWDIRNREDLQEAKAFYVFHDEDEDTIHLGTADVVPQEMETE
tara:strand:- start:86 stop:403 length:318 start_codon:yes stop_codon:yes gene_type:complete